MKLSEEELLVLDWVMCEHGDAPTDERVNQLGDNRRRSIRERVWRARLASTQETGKNVIERFTIDLSDYECEMFLAIVPTTLRWSAGEDAGFELKMKLADQLWGEEVREKVRADAALDKAVKDILSGVSDATSTQSNDNPNPPDVSD